MCLGSGRLTLPADKATEHDGQCAGTVGQVGSSQWPGRRLQPVERRVLRPDQVDAAQPAGVLAIDLPVVATTPAARRLPSRREPAELADEGERRRLGQPGIPVRATYRARPVPPVRVTSEQTVGRRGARTWPIPTSIRASRGQSRPDVSLTPPARGQAATLAAGASEPRADVLGIKAEGADRHMVTCLMAAERVDRPQRSVVHIR